MPGADDQPPSNESRTALGVAGQRAAHLWLDDPPPILDDGISARLAGPDAEAFIRGHAERFRRARSMALRATVVARSRFAEDELAAAAVRGVRQAVILGAGLDTFAYRQPAWASDLRIAELDHPASQAAKLDRLASAGVAIPGNVRHVPIDLVTGDLAAALDRAGLDRLQPMLIAWLGVMMYLPPDASDRVADHRRRAGARIRAGAHLRAPGHPGPGSAGGRGWRRWRAVAGSTRSSRPGPPPRCGRVRPLDDRAPGGHPRPLLHRPDGPARAIPSDACGCMVLTRRPALGQASRVDRLPADHPRRPLARTQGRRARTRLAPRCTAHAHPGARRLC